MDAMLAGGASWAVERGWGEARDLERIEEDGKMTGAQPANVSEHARERQRREMGTLGCVSSEGWCVQQEINLPGQESGAP
jgi:tRNA-splicing ligase RtcB